MISLRNYIESEIFEDTNMYEDDTYIVEGVVYDADNKIVKLTDTNKGVYFDNSYEEEYNGMKVISIFRRNNKEEDNNIILNKEEDGNPFIYALKQKNGWKFEISNEEIIKYMRKFIERCNELSSKKFDTIISLPSSSIVNKRFMDVIYNNVNATYKTDEVLDRLSKDEAQENIDNDAIKKDYPNPNERKNVYKRIRADFNRMLGEDFEAKKIKKSYLKYIKYIIINREKRVEDISEHINNKDVLILDDIFSSGETVSQGVKNIEQTFCPNSVTVITLLSRKLSE